MKMCIRDRFSSLIVSRHGLTTDSVIKDCSYLYSRFTVSGKTRSQDLIFLEGLICSWRLENKRKVEETQNVRGHQKQRGRQLEERTYFYKVSLK